MSLRNFLIMNIPLCFTQILFLHLSLKPKHNKYITFFLLFIPFTFLALMKQTIPEMNQIVSASAAIVYSFVYTMLMYNEKFKRKCVKFFINYVILYAVSVIFISFYSFIGGNIFNPHISFIIFHDWVVAMAFLIYWIRGKKHIYGMENNKFTIIGMSLMFGLHIVLFFLLEALYLPESIFDKSFAWSFNIDSNDYFALVFMVVSIILFVTDLLMIYVMNRASRSVAMQKDIELFEYKQSLYADYYAEIEASSVQTRKIRHDMANIVETIGAMIQSGDNQDKEIANELYEKLQIDIQNIRNEVFCSDNLLNAILSIKANICRDKNICPEFSVMTEKFSILEKTDLCKVATNLLDNAIKATDTVENDRKIIFKISADENSLFISLVNPIGKMFQSPDNDKAHGYGLKILNDVARKNKGEFTTEEDSDVYISQMIIPIT